MRVTRIGHVGFTVPDLDSYTKFFTDVIGLQVTARDDARAFLTCSHRWAEVRLTVGDQYGCDAWGLDVSDAGVLDEMVAEAGKFGLELLDDSPSPIAERVVRLAGDSIPVLELCHGANRAPVGYDGTYGTIGPRPLKLGHLTLLSSDFDKAESILADFLQFRLSDTVPELFRWYRCNSDHHGIGLGHGPDLLHHCAFELSCFEEFRALGDHVVREGRQLVWGPGRHGPGNNLFTYMFDPGGGLIEHYCGLLQIEDEANYVPAEFTPEQAGNRWGPATIPPDEWVVAGSPFIRGAAVST